ncbi:hypothetical protein EGW08_021487 [Elysia chlorotica]|uniref:Endonuclease/exonuclease/phosphatase domain-containing protein n=1 Tax=Elysia chlorotica TaxID=188477 RepID=A0A3S0Z6X9_ELYCH|nr:hypothetical protein EGW08_021487 [Elysia chlorotica]
MRNTDMTQNATNFDQTYLTISWYSKHSKAIMVCGVLTTILIVATVIAVPTTIAKTRKTQHSQTAADSKTGADVNILSLDSSLSVAAFNIKSFGESKSINDFAFQNIVKIISRYDVILIQEVRDKSGSSISKLWQSLNETGSPYGLVHSERLGRTSYKEQYVFFYHADKAELTGKRQFDDNRQDVYEREPFTIELSYFSQEDMAKKRIALMALHTAPKDAFVELEQLPGVMRSTLSHLKHSHGLIAMGDFNADCAYLSNKKKAALELFEKGGAFRSLIQDSADTTVSSSTDCAYDRAVVYGKGVKVSDAKVFDFQTAFGMTESEAKQISDHYPIEFRLL